MLRCRDSTFSPAEAFIPCCFMGISALQHDSQFAARVLNCSWLEPGLSPCEMKKGTYYCVQLFDSIGFELYAKDRYFPPSVP